MYIVFLSGYTYRALTISHNFEEVWLLASRSSEYLPAVILPFNATVSGRHQITFPLSRPSTDRCARSADRPGRAAGHLHRVHGDRPRQGLDCLGYSVHDVLGALHGALRGRARPSRRRLRHSSQYAILFPICLLERSKRANYC